MYSRQHSTKVMRRHRFVLTLGSNDRPSEQIAWTLEQLAGLPLELRSSTPRSSSPVAFPLSSAPVTDVVLLGATARERDDLQRRLKALEQRAGRTPEQRRQHPERIPVDIDLITWNGTILKPKDCTRPYLQQGLAELGIPLLD